MLVVPGGSYEKVCITHEGYKTAEWLNEHGIAAMILKYRMPNGHPGFRSKTASRRCASSAATPHNGVSILTMGIIGFSAGGHFASTLITEYTSEETRPDFAVLVYPVVSMNYSSVRPGRTSSGPAAKRRHCANVTPPSDKCTKGCPR